LLLAVGQDVFRAEHDLAICHSLAGSFRAALQMHPTWGLADLRSELDSIARNKRSISGLSLTDAGYQAVPGQVVVTTAHKGKGLEWDGVFLICADNLEFPSSLEDAFRGEAFYMPGRAPAVESRMRLEQMLGGEFAAPLGRPLLEQARLEYIAERLRLLYVAITRARHNLIITHGQKNGQRQVTVCSLLPEIMEG